MDGDPSAMWSLELAQIVSFGGALLTVPVLILSHAAMRGFLWGLPAAALVHFSTWWLLCRTLAAATDPFSAVDWLAGGALLVAIWLGWFQIFSTLCRGFSMQLLVEIEGGARTARDLQIRYAGGRGMGWLLDKRISGLENTGFIELEERAGEVILRSTSRGRALARVSRLYKKWAGIGAGG